MADPKVLAVVQARMGSSRLPGKSLRPVCGKPLVWHVVHRLRRCETVHGIVVATTRDPSDDPLEAFAAEEGVLCVRGPVDEVLDRFVLAADTFDADVVVRVTGDAPFVDPGAVDAVVRGLLEANAEFCVSVPEGAYIHEGFEPVRADALRRLQREHGDERSVQEHVTAWFKQHPEQVPTAEVTLDARHRFRGARISVDTPADVAFVERVHAELGAAPGEVDLAELVALLERQPELLEINRHVRQKTAAERSRRALLLTEAGHGVGYGHLLRTIAVGSALRDACSWGVTVGRTAAGADRLAAAGLPSEDVGDLAPDALAAWARGLAPDAVVVDARSAFPPEACAAVREATGATLAVIDDGGPRRLVGDLAFYPPTEGARSLEWPAGDERARVGWEWVVLPNVRTLPVHEPQTPPRALVCFGGSDPYGLTARVLPLLAKLERRGALTVVLGPGFADPDGLRDLAARVLPGARLVSDPEDLPGLVAEADLVLTGFGVSSYEVAAMGRAGAFLTHGPDDARAAELLVEAGAGVHLGQHAACSDEDLRVALRELFALDQDALRAMGRAGAALLDGEGAQRIAREIERRVREGAAA